MKQAADSIAGDTMALPPIQADTVSTDSIAADTLVAGEIPLPLVMTDPATEYLRQNPPLPPRPADNGMSWVYLALTLLFCAGALKFNGSKRYLRALFADLSETRARHNAFDDTVKETSLLVLLNLIWTLLAGILLWTGLLHYGGADTLTGNITGWTAATGIALCTGACLAYIVFINLAYWIVGIVFSDKYKTSAWVKGAAASTGLECFLLFPIALVALTLPHIAPEMAVAGVAVFAVGKLIFIFKGFRIFFSQVSSWLLFLYYLCSLEIVPVILTFLAASALCTRWL